MKPYLATDAQRAYVKRLLNECFSKRIEHKTCLDPHHLDRLTFDDASDAIDKLKKLFDGGRALQCVDAEDTVSLKWPKLPEGAYVRVCQECSHAQIAKNPAEQKGENWRELKCCRCKSEAMDYGRLNLERGEEDE